jgi:hypothetical protein
MKQLPLLREDVPRSQLETTAYQVMTPLVLTVEGVVSVEYLIDILKMPYSQYPVLNSQGNIVGMMPKNFLIVMIENHHWMNLSKLSQGQLTKLKEMYRSLEHLKLNNKGRFRTTVKAANRRFTTKQGIIGPQDWYMKEFSRETMNYFMSHRSFKIKRETLTDIQ